jgi:peroxiredoxin
MKRVGLISVLILLLAVTDVFAGAPRVGERIAPFRSTNLAGKTVDTGQLRGRTMVIYFWNDKCGCSEQLIALRKFITGLKERPFSFITVNEGQRKSVAERFINENNLPYEVLLDSDMTVGTKQFGIKVLPTIFVIDRGGILREKMIGVIRSNRLESIISRYL